jgi:transposase
MDATASSNRQARGAALVKAKARSFKHIAGESYFVPSATNAGSGYIVDVSGSRCTCPDFEETGRPCKHFWAVRYFRHELEMPDGTTVVTQEIRVSYPQADWGAYTRAQCNEEATAKSLLASLCDGIEQPEQKMGRPRLPLRDVVFGMTCKVYGTMSGRRSTTDLRACQSAGLMTKAPAYNSISRHMQDPALLPLLTRLVEESARPLAAVERSFAIDSTGFARPSYSRWVDHKYGDDRRVHDWLKCHASVGTKTNVIASVVVTPSNVNDAPLLAPLVERTNQSFTMHEVSADKAYLSNRNIAAIEAVGAKPFIPFKSNSGMGGSPGWERMYHYFALNRETFMAHYHKRSNVEATFSALKRKFGAAVRAKTPEAQAAEVVAKCLCFNLSRLVHAIHELGIEPKFWTSTTGQA